MLKKDIFKITLIIIFAYKIIPIVNRLSPATEIYTFLTDLWITNSISVPLPSTESMKTELTTLVAKKDTLLAEYRVARSETHEYETIKQNVDALLAVPKGQEQQRRHE